MLYGFRHSPDLLLGVPGSVGGSSSGMLCFKPVAATSPERSSGMRKAESCISSRTLPQRRHQTTLPTETCQCELPQTHVSAVKFTSCAYCSCAHDEREPSRLAIRRPFGACASDAPRWRAARVRPCYSFASSLSCVWAWALRLFASRLRWIGTEGNPHVAVFGCCLIQSRGSFPS